MARFAEHLLESMSMTNTTMAGCCKLSAYQRRCLQPTHHWCAVKRLPTSRSLQQDKGKTGRMPSTVQNRCPAWLPQRHAQQQSSCASLEEQCLGLQTGSNHASTRIDRNTNKKSRGRNRKRKSAFQRSLCKFGSLMTDSSRARLRTPSRSGEMRSQGRSEALRRFSGRARKPPPTATMTFTPGKVSGTQESASQLHRTSPREAP